MAGLSAPKIEGKFSLRASVTGEIVMDEVEVPEANLLPNASRASPARSAASTAPATASPGGRWARPRPAGTRAAAIRARPQAVRPAARRQPARPEEARRHADRDRPRPAGALRVGRLFDEGRVAARDDQPDQAQQCGKALDIARVARDMHGGNGIADEFQVIRHVLNLETVNTYEGTHDVHALILGRAQTGHPGLLLSEARVRIGGYEGGGLARIRTPDPLIRSQGQTPHMMIL